MSRRNTGGTTVGTKRAGGSRFPGVTTKLSATDDRSYDSVDFAIIGGGPAGSAAARHLAARGHRVVLIARDADRVRGFAESLPPSTRPLLSALGIAAAMDDGGFIRSHGNTVWWAGREHADERFGDASSSGYQVFRPAFDRLLLEHAAAGGAEVWRGATVIAAVAGSDAFALDVQLPQAGVRSLRASFVLDCSGRSGVLARAHRIYQRELRGQALIGGWRAAAWPVADRGHTLVESWDDGWGWSVPAGTDVRHVGIMIDAPSSGLPRGDDFTATYHAALSRMPQLGAVVTGATLERAWACDASVYCSKRYGGDRYLLVGDAASFIEPLSSFGVKKALASAYIAAVAAHTWLRHPDRRAMAIDFFTDWERRVFATSLERSRKYAREAFGRHPRPFWETRASVAIAPHPATAATADVEALLAGGEVRAAYDRLRAAPAARLAVAASLRIEPRPVIRDHELVAEDAVVLAEGAVRFVRDIDVLMIVAMARHQPETGELVARYVERSGARTLPNLLAAIALLLARGVLVASASTTHTKT